MLFLYTVFESWWSLCYVVHFCCFCAALWILLSVFIKKVDWIGFSHLFKIHGNFGSSSSKCFSRCTTEAGVAPRSQPVMIQRLVFAKRGRARKQLVSGPNGKDGRLLQHNVLSLAHCSTALPPTDSRTAGCIDKTNIKHLRHVTFTLT